MHIAFIYPSATNASIHKLAYTMTRYSTELMQALLLGRQEIHITAVSTTDPTSQKPENPAHSDIPDRCTVHRCFSWNTYGLLSLMWKVRWSRFDLAHMQHETFLYGGPLSLFLFPLVVRWIRRTVPTVVTLHHVIHPEAITRQFTSAFKSHIPPWCIRWGFFLFYRLIGCSASHCIVHETCDKAILVKDYGIPAEKISVIPHGAETMTMPKTADRASLLKKFRLPPDAERVFGFFSYLDLSKGIDILLEEFRVHLTAHPHDVLIIGGALNPHFVNNRGFSQEMKKLRDQAEHTENGRISWFGEIPPDHALDFFRLIDALILPYRIFNGGSAVLSRAISFNVPCFVSEAFASCATGPAIIFPLHRGGLSAQLHRYSAIRLPLPADPAFAPWRNERLWPAVSAKTFELYRSLAAEASQPRILLLGAYGQHNLGDEILLATCLDHLPRPCCTVASNDPECTKKDHDVQAVPRQISRALCRALLMAKAIVVGGGDQFKLLKASTGRSRYSLLLLCALLAVTTRILRKRLYFVSVGIGDISTSLARFLTRNILRLATAVSFRERESYELCRTIAPHSHAFLSADLAFLSSHIPEHHRNHAQSGTLGIAPVFAIDQADQYAHITQQLGRAVDGYLGRDPQRSVRFLPFQPGFNAHHDVLVSEEILAHVAQGNRCSVENPFGIERVQETYCGLDALWGMRLHSIILACLYAVPFVALLYDVKVKRFLEAIDCASWGIALDASFSAEKLLDLQLKLHEHAQDIRHHLRAQTERLVGNAEVSASLLRTIATEMGTVPVPDRGTASPDDQAGFHPLPSAT